MDLWDWADVLWLDLAIDVYTHGLNMDFPEPLQKFKKYPSPRLSAELADVLTKTTISDIEAGHTIGFFPAPPFTQGYCIPTVLVPKSDGGQRICKNYSKPNVNEITGKVTIRPQPFKHAVNAFTSAGPGCFFVVWDVEGAYPTLRIQNADQPLTQCWVPGSGYAYRLGGDFGAAVCGYRWELFGGRMLNTLYACMSTRMRWITARGWVAVGPPPRCPVRPTQAKIRRSPASYTTLGKWDDQEIMFSPAGKLLWSQQPIMAPMTGIIRRTDDFFLPVRR